MKERVKVFVAMSGGVDSSVAAALLKERGFDVVGIHMRCYNVDGCAEQDAEDARRAAEILRIPFYVFDFEKEYKEEVVNYMIDGYRKGITPNPDVMCNKEIKFGLFLKKALAMGADYVATGHYVRLAGCSLRKSGRVVYSLLSAKDNNKDQSYFLWTLKQDQLKHCLFPIGDYKKPQVRKLAVKFGLLNAEKKDSQGICFLGQVSLPDFLKKYIKPKKGKIVDIDGNILGEHNGAYLYTIGQRHRLNISMRPRRFKEIKTSVLPSTEAVGLTDARPYYVVSKDVKKNIVVVVEGDDHPSLYKKEVQLTKVNFLDISSLRGAQSRGNLTVLSVYVRVRYRQLLFKASLKKYPERSEGLQAKLVFSRPMKFVASGQSAVFYNKKGAMLGGGIIKSAA